MDRVRVDRVVAQAGTHRQGGGVRRDEAQRRLHLHGLRAYGTHGRTPPGSPREAPPCPALPILMAPLPATLRHSPISPSRGKPKHKKIPIVVVSGCVSCSCGTSDPCSRGTGGTGGSGGTAAGGVEPQVPGRGRRVSAVRWASHSGNWSRAVGVTHGAPGEVAAGSSPS